MIICGDAIQGLKSLASNSVNACVTSPPYWGLRDYGHAGQIGLESSLSNYVSSLVNVFREVRRVLKDDGTLWLNLGDSYAASAKNRTKDQASRKTHLSGGISSQLAGMRQPSKLSDGLKAKDLCGVPWRVAFALQEDGWYLRQDIIWHKPNPMPESVTDRCTKAHEYIFLLSKSPKYYFDNEAILEPAKEVNRVGRTKERAATPLTKLRNDRTNSGGFTPRLYGSGNKDRKPRPSSDSLKAGNQAGSVPWEFCLFRNKRSVWSVTTKPFRGAHFATFPPDLIRPCVLAGCPEGGVVLDPFFGAGTTGLVAMQTNRQFIGIEINSEYIKIAEERLKKASEV